MIVTMKGHNQVALCSYVCLTVCYSMPNVVNNALSKSGPARKLKTFYASAIYFALDQCTR